MDLHAILVHLHNNWHKYGVAYLLFKDFRDALRLIFRLRDLKENLTWLRDKIASIFKRN
jgi:hypothetical protein